MAEREEGFYWVLYAGIWVVAEYQKNGWWWYAGQEDPLTQHSLEEIDERRIERLPSYATTGRMHLPDAPYPGTYLKGAHSLSLANTITALLDQGHPIEDSRGFLEEMAAALRECEVKSG